MWKYMTLGVRFSLVMQINWDVYECNKILGLDYPHFSHCIIVYTLTNQNTYFCQNSIRLCVSVANHPQLKAITLWPADFFQPITYSLLAVTQLFFSWLHTQIVYSDDILHIRCPKKNIQQTLHIMKNLLTQWSIILLTLSPEYLELHCFFLIMSGAITCYQECSLDQVIPSVSVNSIKIDIDHRRRNIWQHI